MFDCLRKFALAAALVGTALVAHGQAETEDAAAQELLRKSDHARNPGRALRFVNTLAGYRADRPGYTARFSILSKTDRRTGQYRNLVAWNVFTVQPGAAQVSIRDGMQGAVRSP